MKMLSPRSTLVHCTGVNNSAVGVGLDTTANFTGTAGAALASSSTYECATATYNGVPGIGFHFLQATEFASGTTTFLGDGATNYTQNGLNVLFMA